MYYVIKALLIHKLKQAFVAPFSGWALLHCPYSHFFDVDFYVARVEIRGLLPDLNCFGLKRLRWALHQSL